VLNHFSANDVKLKENANWGVTSYIEGALDVWLDNGLKSNYEIDVSWTKSFNKHFSEYKK
jgi:hypothetical protein